MLTKIIEESIETKQHLLDDRELLAKVIQLAQDCLSSLERGGKIIFCGNGGSFADAQHLSAEFTSRFLFDRPGIASIALGTNSSSLTAISNDYGYENVFSREVDSLAHENDIVIAITTSGRSKNVLKLIETLTLKGISFVVWTGESNGDLPLDTPVIKVPSFSTARIQESHIMIGHIICELVEKEMFGNLYK